MMFGMDAMIAISLAYLMIGPAGATLSMDRWLAVRRARRLNPNAIVPLEPSIAANIATRMFQIHFCFIYAASGVSKLQGPTWWNGTALWLCVANYSFAPMELAPYKWFLHVLCSNRFLWEVFLSASALFTLFLEIGLPFLIWTRRFRWLMVCGSVMLHLGIGLIMGLVGFRHADDGAGVLFRAAGGGAPPDRLVYATYGRPRIKVRRRLSAIPTPAGRNTIRGIGGGGK